MAKLKLKAITDGKDKNRFCGPSVISALTGLTTGEAARLIRKQTGKTCVMGTHISEVLNALRACNITSWGMKLSHAPSPTLARWLKLSKADRTPGRIFLIIAGWHWQLVSGRRYTCGRIREIVSIKDKRVKRRARVEGVWELFSDKVTKPDIDVSKPKDPFSSARARARRIEKKIDAEIDNGEWTGNRDTGLFVYPPSSITDENDPYAGDHSAGDWHEALEMLKDYEKMVGHAGQPVTTGQ